nr:hypothetical protein [uncultured Pedobacter sp.]
MLKLRLLSICVGIVLVSSCAKETLLKEEVKSPKIKTNALSLSTTTSLQTELKLQWNVLVGSSDYMTTIYTTEANNFPVKGQSYYLPSFSSSSTSPLYRAYNGSKHMVTTSSTGEGNYTVEGNLGYGYNSSSTARGTVNMFRSYSSAQGDYTLSSPNYSIASYTTPQYFSKYGYPRYNSNTSLLTLNGSQISIKSNRVAGGALWELSWNGKQFVNTTDYGRLIQASMNLGNGALPTEGGDVQANTNPNFSHGSPLIEAYNSGSTQVTTAVPLEWNNVAFNSTGNIHDLVIYKNFKLGKKITLDPSLNLGSSNYLLPQIVKYVTTFYTPTSLSGVHIEIPTGYLNTEFSRFFEIDATQGNLNAGLTEIYLNVNESKQSPHYNAGGLVLATQNLNYAMGIYINIPVAKSVDNDPNSIYYLRNWRFGDTNKWSLGRLGNISSGSHQYTSYIIVGTLDDVRVAMRSLNVNGY